MGVNPGNRGDKPATPRLNSATRALRSEFGDLKPILVLVVLYVASALGYAGYVLPAIVLAYIAGRIGGK